MDRPFFVWGGGGSSEPRGPPWLRSYIIVFSPELNVMNIIFPVAISEDRPNAGVKLAMTLTV